MGTQKVLEYDDSQDKEIFLDEELEEACLRLSACTVANSDGKPNEDAFSVILKDKILWVCVFDGTTSLRPIPKLEGQTGARFASHYLKHNFNNVLENNNSTPREVLLEMNKSLLEEAIKLGGKLSDTHSLPAAMATLVKLDIENSVLDFAHVGDTYGIIVKKNLTSDIFTDDKNKRFDSELLSLMKEVSSSEGITPRQVRGNKEFEQALVNMFIRRNNNPDGSGAGLLNGDPNMSMYIQEGRILLKDVKSVFVATDGVEIQGYDVREDTYRNFIVEEYTKGGLMKLIELKKQSEDADPDWNHLRYKHSDDATAVVITFADN